MRSRLWAVLAVIAGCLFMSSAAASAATPVYPVVYNGLIGYGAHALTPDVPAAGSHYVNWSSAAPAAACHSSNHPDPVVLVPGTYTSQADDFAAVSPLLADNGYCVYSANFGAPAGDPIQTFGDIPTSATELATVVTKVLAATGASKVDLVGHSQGGGVLPRWYLKYDGGASKVSALVGLAPSNHGTTVDGLVALGRQLGVLGIVESGVGVAATQQLDGRRSTPSSTPVATPCRASRTRTSSAATTRWSPHTPTSSSPPAPARPSTTSCCRTSARWIRASTCRLSMTRSRCG
jgi:triacylglycerol esterase/lipase EstA (alpha/beta hydrolase family)